MKHLLQLIVIAVAAAFTSPAMAALSEIGTWEIYPVFAASPVKVIDAGSKVYYVSGGSLFSYDKNENERYSYTSGNKLSDVGVSNIYYNADKKYLIIAYSNGNMDKLSDDGTLVNISDIKDSSIDPPLTINDVYFHDNRIYVATAFGLVEFDGDRDEVVQSGNYSTSVSAVTVMNGNLIICANSTLLSIPVGERFHSISRFTELGQLSKPSLQLIPVSESELLSRQDHTSAYIQYHLIDFATNQITKTRNVAPHTTRGYLTRSADGNILFAADKSLYRISDDFRSEVKLCALPEDFDGCVFGLDNGLEQAWSLNRDGLACHNLSNSEEDITVLAERYRPEPFSVRDVAYLKPAADGSHLNVFSIGSSNYRNEHGGVPGYDMPLTYARIDLATKEAEDFTPYPVDAYMPGNVSRQQRYGKYLFGPTGLVDDPDEPGVFYVGTIVDGVYKIRDGKQEGIYHCNNSPLKEVDSRSIVYGVGIDPGGNLWVATTSSAANSMPLMVLPAEKRRLKPDETSEDDWIRPDTKSVGYAGGQDVQMLFCKKSNMVFISDHNTTSHFFVCDTRGTHNDFSDDKVNKVTHLVDQDGNVFEPTYCSAFAEDKDGAVWIGTDQGVIVLSNPQKAIESDFVVRRVKVPKNDGTNTAEYLLGTDLVYSIAVDAGNRKWMATKQSGLFLVSSDGSRILKNFTTENSPLPTNNITSVYADPSGNTIYVGTAEGLYAYSSDATPAREDFDKITVFPNPVTPDYSGPIYVKGLMENALVKITDAGGSVVYQGRAEGGMFSWNGTNSAGVRLPSGVYYVFASSVGGETGSGGTAKFMIIK